MRQRINIVCRHIIYRKNQTMPHGNIRCQAGHIHHIHKKIVLQGLGNFHQQRHINSMSVKNFIHISTLAMYPFGELRHSKPAFVKNGFHQMPDVKRILLFHIIVICNDIEKRRGKILSYTPGFHAHTNFNKSAHAVIYTTFREPILELVSFYKRQCGKLEYQELLRTANLLCQKIVVLYYIKYYLNFCKDKQFFVKNTITKNQRKYNSL